MLNLGWMYQSMSFEKVKATIRLYFTFVTEGGKETMEIFDLSTIDIYSDSLLLYEMNDTLHKRNTFLISYPN